MSLNSGYQACLTYQALCVLTNDCHLHLSWIGLYALHRSDVRKQSQLFSQLDNRAGISLYAVARRGHCTKHCHSRAIILKCSYCFWRERGASLLEVLESSLQFYKRWFRQRGVRGRSDCLQDTLRGLAFDTL